MEGDLDCAVCLTTQVAPVQWPSSCGHKFCHRCVFSLVEKNSSKCPLCRSAVSLKFKPGEVLTGRHQLQKSDDAFTARCREVDPEEYDAREEADTTFIQSTMERFQYARARRRPCLFFSPPLG